MTIYGHLWKGPLFCSVLVASIGGWENLKESTDAKECGRGLATGHVHRFRFHQFFPTTRFPPKHVPSDDHFFTHCRLTTQPPRATASVDNAALGSLQASTQVPGQTTGLAGARLELPF
ncbi:UNVERIFIED_CONTAM: hypothetical protein FKN15_061730 [Acipenser sinensis]